uniref:Uncharacterized protein n=1 Tax=Periophthalmus magnuspinnatus TaxID=409849 RepID=A0A3B3ZDM5_9GOBI
MEFMRSKLFSADQQKTQLQEELSASLKTSLMGLQTLDVFLDAVERLAVTSVQVFQEENPVLLLPEGGDLGTVQDIITAAKNICPLLVEFKRDNKEFFNVGQAAARGPLALSRGARGGFIALNALFLGMDVFFIVKDSMSLARGSETELSKFIRARSALWHSEMTSWQKIHKLLENGKPSFKRKQAILMSEFYLEEEIQREGQTIWETD